MRLDAAGGTDGATMVLFWPDNLPEDADAALADDPMTLIERLDAEGKLVHLPCAGDGGYRISVFVREELPPDLAAVCREDRRYPRLTVAGDGYFGGGESLFKRDASFLQKYPHMAEKLAVPAGTYAATVYQTDVPRGMSRRWLRDRVDARARLVERSYEVLWPASLLAALATLVGFVFVSRTMGLVSLGVTAALICATVVVSRSASWRRVRAAYDAFATAYPDYVVRLQ
jgi:hypothetical protein